jgi:hypothetical protein
VPAEKYRNRDGNQQTSVDFDGRITSLRRGVFKRQCIDFPEATDAATITVGSKMAVKLEVGIRPPGGGVGGRSWK